MSPFPEEPSVDADETRRVPPPLPRRDPAERLDGVLEAIQRQIEASSPGTFAGEDHHATIPRTVLLEWFGVIRAAQTKLRAAGGSGPSFAAEVLAESFEDDDDATLYALPHPPARFPPPRR